MDSTITGWRAFGVPGDSDTNPHSERATFGTFLPGTLGSTWEGSSWTLDKAITVTRMEARAKTPLGAGSSCTTSPVIRVWNGGATSQTLTIGGTGTYFDTGAISVDFAASDTLTTGVSVAASGCTLSGNPVDPPKDVNVIVQYRLK